MPPTRPLIAGGTLPEAVKLAGVILAAPFPEEFNRRVATLATTLHFAPIERAAAAALAAEGIDPATIQVTGNTVIDALLWTAQWEREGSGCWQQKHAYLGDRPLVLVKEHRRESFGTEFESICRASAALATEFPNTAFFYPVHLNPQVRLPVQCMLGDRSNVHLVQPAPYPEFVWLMDRAPLILTDSGGVQEEAPSLGKPVLVMRDTTERQEAIAAGAAKLVGTDTENIVSSVRLLLTDENDYQRLLKKSNPYGDRRAAGRIVRLMKTMRITP